MCMGLKVTYIQSTWDHPRRMGLDMLSLNFIEKYKRSINPLKELGWQWGGFPSRHGGCLCHSKAFNVLGCGCREKK